MPHMGFLIAMCLGEYEFGGVENGMWSGSFQMIWIFLFFHGIMSLLRNVRIWKIFYYALVRCIYMDV